MADAGAESACLRGGSPAVPRLRRASQSLPDWGAAPARVLRVNPITRPALHPSSAGLVKVGTTEETGLARAMIARSKAGPLRPLWGRQYRHSRLPDRNCVHTCIQSQTSFSLPRVPGSSAFLHEEPNVPYCLLPPVPVLASDRSAICPMPSQQLLSGIPERHLATPAAGGLGNRG
jgi:hypothetical protein